MKKLSFLVLLALATPVCADVTINLDAGALHGAVNATNASDGLMQVDNNFGSLDGSLLLLIDTGSGSTSSADNLLTTGQYVSGGNLILAAGGFNENNGPAETSTVFDIPGSLFTTNTISAGDNLVLRYFPQITYQEYLDGTLPSVGLFFNTVSASDANVAADNAAFGNDSIDFVVPANGSSVDLSYFTTDSAGGGSEPVANALFQVSDRAAVPEPSSLALLLLSAPLALWALRRRARSINRGE
ncbi:MAG: PEP-CTERM sorting domain-containing protein [Verrucomicrobiota bacterium]